MNDPERLAALEQTVAALVETVRSLGERVASLEAGAGVRGGHEVGRAVEPGTTAEALTGRAWRRLPALAGRSFVVLAGAFLLRAIVEAGALPAPVGVLLGLVYAGLWVGAAARAGGEGADLSSAAHGLCAAAIGYPIVWEASVRFEVLGAAASALLILALAGVGLTVAWRRGLGLLAWAVVLGGALTAAGLSVATHRPAPFVAVMIALGLGSAWAAYATGWDGLRWPLALLADVGVLETVTLAGRPQGAPPPYEALGTTSALVLALALLVGYGATFVARSLRRHRDVVPFEVVQTLAVFAIGFGGAVHVARQTGLGVMPLAVTAVGLGLAAYRVAFTAVIRRLGRGRNYLFFTSLGLLFVLVGAGLLFSAPVAALSWGMLGVVAAGVGGANDRITLRVHAAVLLAVAGVQSGLAATVGAAWSGGTAAPAGWSLGVFAALGLAAAAYAALVVTEGGREQAWYERIPRFLTAVVALSGVSALLVRVVAFALASLGPALPPEASMAAVRTIALAVIAIAAAGASRQAACRELGWVVWPLLLAAAGKLLVDDLRHPAAGTLFAAFAAYGLALLVAPWLVRRGREAPQPAAGKREAAGD